VRDPSLDPQGHPGEILEISCHDESCSVEDASLGGGAISTWLDL
jgi:hypothetical protein